MVRGKESIKSRDTMTVSYTHLDVYKRQIQYRLKIAAIAINMYLPLTSKLIYSIDIVVMICSYPLTEVGGRRMSPLSSSQESKFSIS